MEYQAPLAVDPNEKKRIENVLRAFESYTKGCEYFDIFYSEKFGGYFQLTNPDAYGSLELQNILTFETVLRIFIESVAHDVRDEKVAGYQEGTFVPTEADEISARLMPTLKTLGEDSDAAIKCLEDFLDFHKKYPF